MENHLSLSIIVPTRDTRALTLKCVESLEKSLQGDAEVVVIDDGSRDGTSEELARRFPWVRILRNESPEGFSFSANRGLSESRGSTLLLLNSDTEVPRGSLECLTAALQAHDRLGVAGARLFYPDGKRQWSGGSEPGLLWLFGLTSNLAARLGRVRAFRRLRPVRGSTETQVDWVTGAALAMRREVLDQVGLLDEGFRFYCQDLDFCLRAADAGWEIRIVPGFRVIHHHGGTISKISQRGGSSSRDIELLCLDLLRWAHIAKGGAWARRAARVMRLGLRLRVVCRTVATPFVSTRYPTWHRSTLTLKRALRCLTLENALASP